MMSRKEFCCHKIAGGVARGELVVSDDDICFYLVDPETGKVIEKGHALEGRSIAGKVLAFPSGKGSSVVQADGLYQLQLKGNAPKAMIVRFPDTVLVASAIIMEVPMVDRLPEDFYSCAKEEEGSLVNINADEELVLFL